MTFATWTPRKIYEKAQKLKDHEFKHKEKAAEKSLSSGKGKNNNKKIANNFFRQWEKLLNKK